MKNQNETHSILEILLLVLAGIIIGVSVYGCKKEEPKAWEEKLYKTTKISFTSEGDIFVMNADGSEKTTVESQPFWSPDGKKIAFTSIRDGNGEIYIMNADGSGQKNLTNNDSAYDGYPSWSPFLDSEKETLEDKK